MLLRRLPAVLLLYRGIGQLPLLRDALFTGWFGPIGVAALFYAMLSLHETQQGIVWAVASLVIFSSLIVHGLSATPLTMLYGKVAQQHSEQQNMSPDGSGSGMQQGHKPAAEHQ